MSSISLKNTSGNAITLQSSTSLASDVTLTLPVNDGDASQFLQTDGAGVLSWATPTDTTTNLTRGTSVTLGSSGAIFDNLPSGIRRITMILWEVSTDGNDFAIRIGDSGGIESSDYLSWDKRFGGSSFSTAGGTTQTGFRFSTTGTSEWSGNIVLTNPDGNDWVCTAQIVDQSDNVRLVTGKKSLSAELDRIQIDVYSTGNIDNGSANIFYEV